VLTPTQHWLSEPELCADFIVSAAARRSFLVGGGGAPTKKNRRRRPQKVGVGGAARSVPPTF